MLYKGYTTVQVVHMMLVTQYLDVLKDFALSGRATMVRERERGRGREGGRERGRQGEREREVKKQRERVRQRERETERV